MVTTTRHWQLLAAGSSSPGMLWNRLATAVIVAVALSGCAARGTPYPDVMAHAAPLDATKTRVVFLRPGNALTYSAARAAIRIDGEKVASLGHGGFFYVDLPPGTAIIGVSAGRTWTGVCEVQLHAKGGDTVYLDVGPRTAHAVAALVGGTAAGVAAEAALPAAAIERIFVDAAAVGAATAVGTSIATSVESIGRKCGGPYRLKELPAAEARPRLLTLAWSR